MSLTFLNRYYCTFGKPVVSKEQQSNADIHALTSYLSTDITLTALTQLGVHRFGCNRSFVSIIDGENQHVIAEATASVSLRNASHHLPNDGLFLGVKTLDLVWGVCPHAIRLFTGQDPSCVVETGNITANKSRNIIRDFTLEAFYKDRSYVHGWPYFRFYAEVPLYSPSGYVLGSYCVVDDEPRTEFGDDEVAALQEVADAIAQHLENVRVVQYHSRAENLVIGLTEFVKGHADFDPIEASGSGRLGSSMNMRNHQVQTLPDDDGDVKGSLITSSAEKFQSELRDSKADLTSVSEETSPLFSSASRSEITGSTSLDFDPSEQQATKSVVETRIEDVSGPQGYSSSVDPLKDLSRSLVMDSVPISERITAIFSRASVLLRDSMDLDGVAFFDAYRNDPSLSVSLTPEFSLFFSNFIPACCLKTLKAGSLYRKLQTQDSKMPRSPNLSACRIHLQR